MASYNIIPLIQENHPTEYTGFPFLTLLEFKGHPFITVIDNYTNNIIRAYVLDMCDAENVDKMSFINVVDLWWSRDLYKSQPISFFLSNEGLVPATYKILKTFSVEYITRAIGPVPKFDMDTVFSTKRRKRKDLSKFQISINHGLDINQQ